MDAQSKIGRGLSISSFQKIVPHCLVYVNTKWVGWRMSLYPRRKVRYSPLILLIVEYGGTFLLTPYNTLYMKEFSACSLTFHFGQILCWQSHKNQYWDLSRFPETMQPCQQGSNFGNTRVKTYFKSVKRNDFSSSSRFRASLSSCIKKKHKKNKLTPMITDYKNDLRWTKV